MCQLVQLLKRGGFNLTKFVTNDRQVFESNQNGIVFASPSFEDVSGVSVLGLNWDVKGDTFSVSRGIANELPLKLTQRKNLSSVSSIFDPLGLIAPYTIRGRLILKELWCCVGQSCVTVGAQNIKDAFDEWSSEKDAIVNVKLARCVFPSHNRSNIQLHTFVDASQCAMCAVVYVRFVCEDSMHVNFIVGKCRVAPIR